MNDATSRTERGRETLRQLGWSMDGPVKGLNPRFWAHTVDTIFSDLWTRPGLNMRDREMVTIAVLVALDADVGIAGHFKYAAPKVGLTRDETFEIILHAMYYSGWPRNEAFLRLQKAIDETPNHPWKNEPWTADPPKEEDPQKRKERGQQILRDLGWPMEGPIKGLNPRFWEHTVQTIFCDLWGRPGLSIRDREVITIAVLVALDADAGIAGHFKYAASKVGLTYDEVFEIILHAMYYSG